MVVNIDALLSNADWPKRTPDTMAALGVGTRRVLGGKGSGDFGHSGRPGQVGGSSGDPVTHLEKGGRGVLFRSKNGAEVGVQRKGKKFELLVRTPGGTRQKGLELYSSAAEAVRDARDEIKRWPGDVEITTLGGKGSGNFGHAGRPGERGGSGEGVGGAKVRSEKSLRALKAFIPIHAESQRHAESNELAVRKMLGKGAQRTEGNAPVDVVHTLPNGKKVGIEVKTMINNTNDKITMRRAAMEKKLKWARSNHATVHTVVIDDRGKFNHAGYSGHRLYYMRGHGSFRLRSMTKVQSASHLLDLLAGR